MTSRRLDYLPALDGLRAVGVTLVLVNHAAKPFFLPGAYGVDIFFVLSGFLITTLLWYEAEGTGRIAFGRFYARRAIRLYPALLVVLAFSVAIGLFLLDDTRKLLLETAAAAVYLSPVADAALGQSAFYGHLWTLAAEEYFYLAWPVILIVLIRMKLSWRAMSVLMIGGGIALYLVRAAAVLTIGKDISLLRMGGIAIGCGVALIIAESRTRGNASLNSALGLALLVLAWTVSGRPVLDTFYPPLAAGGTVLILFAVVSGRRTWMQRVLETTPFVLVGRISYELYLWHVPVLLGAATLLATQRYLIWWWAYPVAFALAMGTHFGLAPLQNRLRATLSGRTTSSTEVQHASR